MAIPYRQAHFSPAAERFNLMPAIDRWAVTRVFKIIRTHRDELIDKEFQFSINLSGCTFSDKRSLDFIYAELKRLNIPNNMICFEITETAAITNLASAIHFIAR